MRTLVIFAVALAIPSISIAQAPRCELATVSKQTCKIKPTAAHDYLITAKASADAKHGTPWMDLHITVDGEECNEQEETGVWEDGPASLETTCRLTLTPGTDHEIKGSSTTRDAKATGFELTVVEQ